MKRNKIAAGALALALGLGAVAPSFADDTTYITAKLPKTVEEKVNYDGKTLTKAQFQTALEEASKSYSEYLTAKEDAKAKKEALDVAVERYNKAYEAYRSQLIGIDANNDGKIDDSEWDTYKGKFQTNLDIAVEKLNKMIVSDLTSDQVIAYLDKGYTIMEGSNVNGSKLAKDTTVETVPGEFEQALDRLHKAYAELKDSDSKVASAQKLYREYTAASYEKDRLQEVFDEADAKEQSLKRTHEANMITLTGFADAFNVVISATNNGITVVEKDKTPSKDKITDEQLAKLQETVKNARETLKAVEILKQFMPNTSTANIEKLDKIAAEQRVALEKAEKILKANNITASLFSTAYAAEEEATSEDVDALIDELETNDKEMKDLMKEIDKDAKTDDEKPADDDKKDDDKKDDDKKDDEKPADDDKKDDKKPAENKDNKKDTTKVVKRTANKKAGSNAKTGIAGVAGVAGVLAAASVAYAASKKNNYF